MVAIDGNYAGFVTISDELKDDANQTILAIRNLGIHKIVMLSGDKDSITQKVAGELSISQARGGLLP